MYLLAVCHISQLHVIPLPVQKVIAAGQILKSLFRQNSQGGIQGQAHRVLMEEMDVMVRTCEASSTTSTGQKLGVLGHREPLCFNPQSTLYLRALSYGYSL